MKKVLLGATTLAMGLAITASAHAEEKRIKLDLGGYTKQYLGYVDEDTAAIDERSVDLYRESQIYFSGETTLNNGLTIGFHVETEADGADAFEVDESYLYFSGNWGRVNAGEEDGAAYTLQVAAPSADSNVDGIRQYINPINYAASTIGINQNIPGANEGIDYDNDLARNAEKIAYYSPTFSGFEAAISYTPDLGYSSAGNYPGNPNTTTNTMYGDNTNDVAGDIGSVYEAALRYEGTFDDVDVKLGAGYTLGNLEADQGAADDFEEWNIGMALEFMSFGFGAVYTENNNGHKTNDKNETWVLGLDYKTGAYKFGASYLNNTNDFIGGVDLDTDRYTGGVVYTYGPGLTFRGSVSHIEHDRAGVNFDATSLLLGTQINF